MASPADIPNMADLDLHDPGSDTEDLFASPSAPPKTKPTRQPSEQNTPAAPTDPAPSDPAPSAKHPPRPIPRPSRDDPAARESALRAELERVREVNRTIEGVTASLTKARSNMDTVHTTVHNASALLATWTRILSQTEHNQRLILNEEWHGASRDLEEAEGEEVRRREEEVRRVREEERRREEAERRREEEERRKAVAPSASGRVRGTRGARGVSGTGRSYLGAGSRGRGAAGARGSSATGGGLGRTPSTRGRGRGVS